MERGKRKRRGRPPLAAEEGKRHPLSLRTTKELKEQLEAAHQASGRSLAQEAEHRLWLSFEYEKAIGETARFLASAITAIEAAAGGKSWREDLATNVRVREFFDVYLSVYGPPGAITATSNIFTTLDRRQRAAKLWGMDTPERWAAEEKWSAEQQAAGKRE